MIASSTIMLVLSSLVVLLVLTTQESFAIAKTPIDGIGFSGGGFLLAYHLGVMQTFLTKKLVQNEAIPIAGASAGALVGSIPCSGSKLSVVKDHFMNALTYCANSTTKCIGELDALNQATLQVAIPHNARYKECNNHLFVAVTRNIKPEDPTTPACECTGSKTVGKLIHFYENRGDLITSLRASAFLPMLSSMSCYLLLRHKQTCDGGYTDLLPCPPNTDVPGKFCLKVSVIPKIFWTNTTEPASIYPGIRGVATLPIPDLRLWQNIALNAKVVNQYKMAIFEAGKEDADYWLKQNGY
jgi:hypothetical protein